MNTALTGLGHLASFKLQQWTRRRAAHGQQGPCCPWLELPLLPMPWLPHCRPLAEPSAVTRTEIPEDSGFTCCKGHAGAGSSICFPRTEENLQRPWEHPL